MGLRVVLFWALLGFFPPLTVVDKVLLEGFAGHRYYTGISISFHKEMEGFERFGQMYFSYAYSLNKWLFSEVVLFF